MKRKRIWVLAVVPLIVGFVFAKQLADKRPQLVARDVFADAGLIFSGDEQRFAAVRDESAYQRISAQIVGNFGAERIEVLTDSIDPFLFFSPDGKWIYQLDLDSYYGSTNDMGMDYRNPRPDEKIGLVGRNGLDNQSRATIRFTFPGPQKDFYGAYLFDHEIVVESREKTWYLDANNLRILNTQVQKRSLTSVHLCPDGKTLYRRVYGHTDFWEFLDLPTEKTLWKLPDDNSGFPKISGDGRLSLRIEQGEVVARDTRTGVEKWRLRGPQSGVIALAPDQSAIYEARPNGELWKWPR